ncbi:MAG: hypothetical protein OEQ13_03505 [Acidobacteriota bacterium]|nr:hypothetical protein [Acidobacteriota bacterium]
MPSGINYKLRRASALFVTSIIAFVILGVFSIERLGAGDFISAVVLVTVCFAGIVWSAHSRYSNDGIYNPSRIHRKSKMR